MRILKITLRVCLYGAIFLVSLWAFAIWPWNEYLKCVQPTGVASITDYFQHFGEPYSIAAVQFKGSTYYLVDGQFPDSLFTSLSMVEHRPAYLFDQAGHFVDWHPSK